MKPGISTHLFAFGKLQETHLDLIVDHGFTAIEIWGMRPHVNWYDPAEVRRFSRHVKRIGLEVSSFHLPFYNIFGAPDFHWTYFNHPKEEIRKEALSLACHIVDLCPDFDCRTVVLHGNGWTGKDLDRADRLYRQTLDRFLAYCEEQEVRIAIENVVTPLSKTDVLRKLVDEYDSDHLGLCLDTGHANLNETVSGAIRNCGPRLLATHIADNRGKEDDHLVPFQGEIDWYQTYRLLKHHCPDVDDFIFELMYPIIGDQQNLEPYANLLADCRRAWERLKEEVDD